MKTVLMTPELPIQTGGIGAFVFNFARLLKELGDDVHIVVANPVEETIRRQFQQLESMHISIASISASKLHVPTGYTLRQRIAESAAILVPRDADIVYLSDWEAAGIQLVRARRLNSLPLPVIVTVLHGCRKWTKEANHLLPYTEEDAWFDFAESYLAQHSDYVVSPGEYMLDWVRNHGWKLPPLDRQRVLGLPFFPLRMWVDHHSQIDSTTPAKPMSMSARDDSTQEQKEFFRDVGRERMNSMRLAAPEDVLDQAVRKVPAASGTSGGRFRRILFFGRLESRKGVELFIEAVGRLDKSSNFDSISEIVFLGGPAGNKIGGPDQIANAMRYRIPEHVKVDVLTTLNSFQAQTYLLEHSADTLVVIPSLQENFPLTVIESSLVPGLNILCSNVGSIPVILGPQGNSQLFEPYPASLVLALQAALARGPRPTDELGHYEWEVANVRWRTFHEEVQNCVLQLRDDARLGILPEKSDSPIVMPPPRTKPVDVCLSYYNLGPYLPFTLDSLSQQTSDEFNTIVVNDGSTDSNSISVFEEMRAKYQSRGWQFITTSNLGLSAARNAAAEVSKAEYLVFLDSDDIAAPNLVERFLVAIRSSQDDCLTCYFQFFQGEGWTPEYVQQRRQFYVPTGNTHLLGVFGNDNPFGGAGFIVKRSTFDTVGGFTTDVSKFVGCEDFEFFARLTLQGFQLDVVPEVLLYYRVRDNSMLRTNDPYLNKARVLRVYEEKLHDIGLDGLAYFAAGSAEYIRSKEQQANAHGELAYLINRVSGYLVVKALGIKVRNSLARKLGLPLRLR